MNAGKFLDPVIAWSVSIGRKVLGAEPDLPIQTQPGRKVFRVVR
jgi:hypothetical protein